MGRSAAELHCICAFNEVGEHEVACPEYEAPLTQAEIRQLRAILSWVNPFAVPVVKPQVDSHSSGGEPDWKGLLGEDRIMAVPEAEVRGVWLDQVPHEPPPVHCVRCNFPVPRFCAMVAVVRGKPVSPLCRECFGVLTVVGDGAEDD